MYVTSYDEHLEELERRAGAILPPELLTVLKKKLNDELAPMWDRAVEDVASGAGEAISHIAAERARKFLEAVLAGEEDAARNLFGLSATGYIGRPAPGAAPVIHGRVFESAPLELRRKLVEAHADLLRDARVADLEALLEAARVQIDRLETWQRQRLGE